MALEQRMAAVVADRPPGGGAEQVPDHADHDDREVRAKARLEMRDVRRQRAPEASAPP